MRHRIHSNVEIPPAFALDRAPAHVKFVAKVLERFMPITRVRLGRCRSDVTGVVRFDDRRVFLLFKNGRWTSTSGEDAFTLGREVSYGLNGRHIHYGNVERALKPLITLGLLSEPIVATTREWMRKRWEATSKKDRLLQLDTDARELGHKLVPVRGSK